MCKLRSVESISFFSKPNEWCLVAVFSLWTTAHHIKHAWLFSPQKHIHLFQRSPFLRSGIEIVKYQINQLQASDISSVSWSEFVWKRAIFKIHFFKHIIMFGYSSIILLNSHGFPNIQTHPGTPYLLVPWYPQCPLVCDRSILLRNSRFANSRGSLSLLMVKTSRLREWNTVVYFTAGTEPMSSVT